MEKDSWITILTFTAAHEASIACAYLDHHGIVCFLRDENLVSIQPFYSNAVGGVKLQVKSSDLDQAKLLLEEGGYTL